MLRALNTCGAPARGLWQLERKSLIARWIDVRDGICAWHACCVHRPQRTCNSHPVPPASLHDPGPHFILLGNSIAFPYGVAALAVGIGHLGYTYWLYPRLVQLLPVRAPVRSDAFQSSGRVSVVIAARQPGALIASKARNVLDQGPDVIQEMVVVLDGPDSAAREALLALADDRLVILELPEWCGKAAALNAGVRRATGDVLVMTDARQRLRAGAIERLIDVLQSPDIGAVSAALEIGRAEGRTSLLDWYWQRERDLRNAEAGRDSAVGVSGALYAVRRTHWRDLPAGLLLDDLAVAMNVVRAGARVAFAMEATVDDVPVGSDRTEFARKVRTLTGNFQYIAWNPWVLMPWQNRIWWEFLSHKVLRLLTPVAIVFVVLGAVLVASSLLLPAIAVAGVLGAFALVASRLRMPFAMSVARTVRSALMINGALLVATTNAFRRRWDVWNDPARPAFRPDR